jgi:hypothetical protein
LTMIISGTCDSCNKKWELAHLVIVEVDDCLRWWCTECQLKVHVCIHSTLPLTVASLVFARLDEQYKWSA